MDSREPSKVGSNDSSNNHVVADIPAASESSPLIPQIRNRTIGVTGGKSTSVNHHPAVSCQQNHKPPKKGTEKVRIDNLPEAELRALLDEAVKYRGKTRDGEQRTELFQALLRETQESGEESPPAFRPTQNLPSNSQKKRRSRKESTGTPPSVQSNNTSVAGSSRKGGSLQNISSHSQSEWGGVRRRKRHDTSDSCSAGCAGSPRKREGGSLPCDVARGSKQQHQQQQLGDPVSAGHKSSPSTSNNDSCVITMEGLAEDRPSSSLAEDPRPEPWKLRMPSRSEHVSTGCIEPMDMEICSTDEVATGPPTFEKPKATESTSLSSPKSAPNYGTMPDYGEVDAAIPLLAFSGADASGSSSMRLDQYSRNSPMNGLPTDDGQLLRRPPPRRSGGGSDYGSTTDENGNPFGGFNGSTISFSPQLPQSRTSPPSSASYSTLNSNSSALTNKPQRTTKSKKRSKEGPAVLSDHMPGFRGDKNVDELLEYIESSGGKTGGDNKATKTGGNGTKQNGTISLTSSGAKSTSGSNKSSSKNSSNKLLTRQVHSNEADSDESDDSASGRQDDAPPSMANRSRKAANSSSPFRTPSASSADAASTMLDEQLAAAASDFQTVTKRQKRKKRNSLSNSTALGSPAGQSAGMNLFYNASSPSVLMRPPLPRQGSTGQGTIPPRPGAQMGSGGHGGHGSVAGSGVGTGAAQSSESKKVTASVPPSEPSDMDSDGGDSVHSLPVQPSAPLYFPPLPSYHHHPLSGPATPTAVTPATPAAPSPWFSYADIIRADAANKSGPGLPPASAVVAIPTSDSGDASGVSFLADLPSQPVDVQQIAAAAAAATCPAAHPPVPCRNRPTPKSTGAPLRRAASLPPTSPSVETPPVVIVGASSSAQGLDDVTFGFELNEQLLALSIQPSTTPTRPHPPPHQPATTITNNSDGNRQRPLLVDLTLDDSGTSSSSHRSPDHPSEPELVTPPSSPPESQEPSPLARPPPSASEPARVIDFASRYRERPELVNRPLSKRSYEIVDFISQAWKRIERKLDEQQQQQQQQIGNRPLQHPSSIIRVYTLE